MGFFKRMFMEKARRTTRRGGNDFDATTNERLDLSFGEAKRFETLLRTFDAKCSAHLKALKLFDESTQHFLGSPLPRMHVMCEDGKVYPVGEQRAIGAAVDRETLASKQAEGREQIYKHVEQPVRLWLASFRAISLSMKELHRQRLVIDSRRRELKKIQARITNEQDRSPEGHTTTTPKMNKFIEEGHKKEAKLAEAQLLYNQQEELCYGNMEALIHDAKFVHVMLKRMFDLLASISSIEAELMSPAVEAVTQTLSTKGTDASSGIRVVEHGGNSARYSPLQEALTSELPKPTLDQRTGLTSADPVVVNHEPVLTHTAVSHTDAYPEYATQGQYVTAADGTEKRPSSHVNVYVPQEQAV